MFRVSIEFLKYVSNWAALAFLQVVFSIILFPQLMIAWTLLSVTHASKMISICAWIDLKSKIARPLPLTAVSRLLEDTSSTMALQLSFLVLPEVVLVALVRLCLYKHLINISYLTKLRRTVIDGNNSFEGSYPSQLGYGYHLSNDTKYIYIYLAWCLCSC